MEEVIRDGHINNNHIGMEGNIFMLDVQSFCWIPIDSRDGPVFHV